MRSRVNDILLDCENFFPFPFMVIKVTFCGFQGYVLEKRYSGLFSGRIARVEVCRVELYSVNCREVESNCEGDAS